MYYFGYLFKKNAGSQLELNIELINTLKYIFLCFRFYYREDIYP